MTREDAKNIFKPFNISQSRKQITGNGVGLSICKQICQKLEGDIQVESEQNKGSKFTFTMKVFLANTSLHKPKTNEAKKDPKNKIKNK